MTDRHAYCIIAHDQPQQLARLVKLIDDPRNDVFILIDAKKDIKPFKDSVKACRSRLAFVANRPRIYWGHYSLIAATLRLFESAIGESDASRVHLLSGDDMPLMSQDEIHQICDVDFPNDEFVDFSTDKQEKRAAYQRVAYHIPLRRYARPSRSVGHQLFRLVRWATLKVCRPKDPGIEIHKGANWISLTRQATEYLLSKESKIAQVFGKSIIGDELFVQTILMASPFASHIHNNGALRAIDWQRGDPYTWRISDKHQLLESGAMFARKFNPDTDPEIISAIEHHVLNKQNDNEKNKNENPHRQ